MPREFGRYLVSTHRDADWGALTTMQHDCYMALLTSEDISWAGVVPYLPNRFSGFAADLTERKVVRTWEELEARGLVVIDKDTGEVLVRTFLKHDNVLAKPNIAKAFCTAHEKVRSERIRAALVKELARLHRGSPDLAGWQHVSQRLPELFAELFTEQLGG